MTILTLPVLTVSDPRPMAVLSGGSGVVLTPRCGTPRRAAILTALAAAAMHCGDLKAVLMLARTGRPRSLIGCGGRLRWLALAALQALHPEANGPALSAALGCRPSVDPRARAEQRRAAWDPNAIYAVARAVAEHEDAHLTASWIWPHACAVAAAHTGADVAAVQSPSGSRASQARAISGARKLAVYLTMIEGDVNATAMAAATGLEKKTVRSAVASIEEQRDEDGDLDAAVETLAATLRVTLDEELSQW
jgi:hypothetical protein